MRCPCCQSWLVRRIACTSFVSALCRSAGLFPYACDMCRHQFRFRSREVPVQVIKPGEAAMGTIQIALSWGL